jgi:N-acetylmuramoyl-L-alanine amidase
MTRHGHAIFSISLLLAPIALALPGATPLARVQGTSAAAVKADDRVPDNFAALAKAAGEPQLPGLTIVYLHPLGNAADANRWENIIVHQTEGPNGSAKSLALAQAKNPSKRGVTLWVEGDGTVYWSTAENAIPTHGDGANRNDNKYIDNSKTYRRVVKTNSIGIEFVGNYPDVARPALPAQVRAWLLLVRFLQERYDIPVERIYAHNWIDYKDSRYCEGCELATLARALAYQPGQSAQR